MPRGQSFPSFAKQNECNRGVSRKVEQRVFDAFVDEPAGAAERAEPLHLVGHPDETPPPGLDVNELRPLSDVRKSIFVKPIVERLAQMKPLHLVEDRDELSGTGSQPLLLRRVLDSLVRQRPCLAFIEDAGPLATIVAAFSGYGGWPVTGESRFDRRPQACVCLLDAGDESLRPLRVLGRHRDRLLILHRCRSCA